MSYRLLWIFLILKFFGWRFFLFFLFFFLKLTIVPFHFWAPDFYQVSRFSYVYFMSIFVKVLVGLFFFKLLAIFSGVIFWPLVYCSVVFNIFIGVILAMQQNNIFRFLAYSGMVHIGFVLFCWYKFIDFYFLFGVFYLFVYAFIMFVIFISMFVIFLNDFGDFRVFLSSIGAVYNFLSFPLVVAFFSLAGIPPLPGFFSKLFVLAIAMSQGFFMPIVIILAILLSTFYYLRLIRYLGFGTKHFSRKLIRFSFFNFFEIYRFSFLLSTLFILTFFQVAAIIFLNDIFDILQVCTYQILMTA